MSTPSTYDVLRLPDVRTFILLRFSTTLAAQMVSVAVGWQVYETTGRAVDLGLVGLVQFVPQLLLFPLAGMVVDRSDRRQVLIGVSALWILVGLCLTGLALLPRGDNTGIFLVLVLAAVARTFQGPAASATLPRLIAPDDIPVAVSWSSMAFTMAVVLGPAVGGLVYGLAGPVATYLLASGLFLGGLGAALRLPSVVAPGTGRPSSVADMQEGMRFILNTPVMLAAASLDLFAVLLGGAVALLPIYARDILHAGPETLGLLRASPALGATLMALWLAHWPLRRRVGPTLLVAVAGFGLATVLFAVSTQVWLSMLALALVGATDEVSVFIRMNIVQIATPDALRGRVSAAEYVFIGASNELGEMESGFLAAAIGPVAAVLAGGIGSLVVVAGCAWLAPQLRRLDSFEQLRPPEAVSASPRTITPAG